MKIAIDCRELRGQAGGFRTYLIGLLEGLAEVDTDNEYLLYVYSPSDLEGIRIPVRSLTIDMLGGRLWSDWFSLRKHINSDSPDVVHFPANYGLVGISVPSVVTLHDCISLDSKARCASMKSEILRRYSAMMTGLSIARASAVITVSNYSRGRIARRFGCDRKLVVTYEAARAKPDCKEVCVDPDSASTKPYLLVLASVDRRKNTSLVIEAFSQTRLARERCRLMVVASHPSAQRLVEREAHEFSVFSLIDIRSQVDDRTLQCLYSGCLAFVFPSLDEGFGLPPLEAMACGAAVISSDRASMPEVLGDAALYFDPGDAVDLADKMDVLVDQEGLRKSLGEAGLRRASAFSWQETARSTLDAYEDAVG